MELDNSEKVQKDFVLLSQSLQQELEKIRGAETEVSSDLFFSGVTMHIIASIQNVRFLVVDIRSY